MLLLHTVCMQVVEELSLKDLLKPLQSFPTIPSTIYPFLVLVGDLMICLLSVSSSGVFVFPVSQVAFTITDHIMYSMSLHLMCSNLTSSCLTIYIFPSNSFFRHLLIVRCEIIL